MKVTVFRTKPNDEQFLREHIPPFGLELVFMENRLKPDTALLARRISRGLRVRQ